MTTVKILTTLLTSVGLDWFWWSYRTEISGWRYECRLQSSWTQLITPSRKFVEVRWRSLFRSTSLDKRCTSYNAPPTSRKHAADRWSLRNFLPRSSLFMVGKAQKPYGAISELNPVFGFKKVDRWNPIRTFAIQSSFRPMRLYKQMTSVEAGEQFTSVYPKVSGLATWNENCKRYSSLPLSAVV
jgi:hypothetical protein